MPYIFVQYRLIQEGTVISGTLNWYNGAYLQTIFNIKSQSRLQHYY